jgi:hypothetical protein
MISHSAPMPRPTVPPPNIKTIIFLTRKGAMQCRRKNHRPAHRSLDFQHVLAASIDACRQLEDPNLGKRQMGAKTRARASATMSTPTLTHTHNHPLLCLRRGLLFRPTRLALQIASNSPMDALLEMHFTQFTRSVVELKVERRWRPPIHCHVSWPVAWNCG